MDCIVYEMSITVYIQKNIRSYESNNYISSLIDKTLSKDKRFLNLHTKNSFKCYCFNNLYPMTSDHIYKEGSICTFKIRSLDKKFVDYIKSNLINEYTNELKVLSIKTKPIAKKHIEKLVSITPIVLTFDEGYWRGKYTIEEVESRIVNNLRKKYHYYTGVTLPDEIEMFTSFRFKNRKPIPTKYKDIYLLGDKIEFKVANNPIAQELAYLSLATSLGEKGGRGFGFTNYIWMPRVV